MLHRIRTFASDLALLPVMWRHLVRQARHEVEQPERLRRQAERRAGVRAEIERRGWWDPAWGPTPPGARELVRGSSF